MRNEIERVLNDVINPVLEQDNGRASFVSEEDGIITIRMEGACATCPANQSTLEKIIKVELQKAITDVREVIMDTSMDDDFYEIAKKILKK